MSAQECTVWTISRRYTPDYSPVIPSCLQFLDQLIWHCLISQVMTRKRKEHTWHMRPAAGTNATVDGELDEENAQNVNAHPESIKAALG